MQWTTRISGWVVAVGLGASTASAAIFNFQSELAGGPPSAGMVGGVTPGNNGGANPGTIVVDSTTSPSVDPFGPAGNKSLMLAKMDSGGADTRARFGFDGFPAAVPSGTIEMDLYFNYPAAGNTSLQIQTNNVTTLGGSPTQFGPNMELYAHSGIIRAYGHTNVFTMDQSATVLRNTAGHLIINFNSGTSTFTASLNGNPLTANGGTVSSFEYGTNGGSITSVTLQNVTSSDNRAFVDNLSLVPEPSSLALLSFAGLALRRRSTR